MSRQSMYLEPYLAHNAARVAEGMLPITPGSYLNKQLRGKAKEYSVHYHEALMNGLRRVGAREVVSIGGGKAYLRKEG